MCSPFEKRCDWIPSGLLCLQLFFLYELIIDIHKQLEIINNLFDLVRLLFESISAIPNMLLMKYNVLKSILNFP